jgi:hypothetical protein
MTDVTRILSAIEEGDPSAAEQLLPLVYDELRRLASAKLAQEKHPRCCATLQGTRSEITRGVATSPSEMIGPRPFTKTIQRSDATPALPVDKETRERARRFVGALQNKVAVKRPRHVHAHPLQCRQREKTVCRFALLVI